MDKLCSEGSGWVFIKNIELSVNVFRYKPFRGGSYIETPKELNNSSKGLINIQNKDKNDNFCFAYNVAAHELKLTGANLTRVTKYKDAAKKYIDGWKDWPMKIDDIQKFEKQFDKCINVFACKKYLD